MSETFELCMLFLQHLVLALLLLGAVVALAHGAGRRASGRPAYAPVRRELRFVSRDRDIRIPVSSGIGSRYPTRGPPLRPDDDNLDRLERNHQ
jgi:hypothetical protein